MSEEGDEGQLFIVKSRTCMGCVRGSGLGIGQVYGGRCGRVEVSLHAEMEAFMERLPQTDFDCNTASYTFNAAVKVTLSFFWR